MNAVQFKDVNVAYQKQIVLKDINVSIPQGKLVGIIGPNGAGKSTFIKALLEIVPTVSGNIYVFQDSYKNMRKKVGYVPQKEEVDWDFPTNVLDVVLMGRYRHAGFIRRTNKEDLEIAKKSLEKVGMASLEKRQISQLSGGQQQRVFLARALAQDASLYLMDEPFTGVDATTEKAIVKLLEEMRHQGKTVIVVHHDLQTVQEYFDWLIMLNQSVIAAGPTEDVFTMKNIQETYGGSVQFLSYKENETLITNMRGD